MPLVKIELAHGKEPAFLIALKDTIMDCVQEALRLPADDRNVRLIEYAPDFFSLKKPYELLVEITLFSGRSAETKKILYQKIVATLESQCGVPKESVFIVLHEQPRENWGVRGGVPASEITLDFAVNI